MESHGELLPHTDPASPAYIHPFDDLAIELDNMAEITLDRRRLKSLSRAPRTRWEIDAAAEASRIFSSHLHRLFVVAKGIWDWKEIAVEVYQQLFFLDHLKLQIGDLASEYLEYGPSQAEFIKSAAAANVSALLNASKEAGRLHRLASKVRAYKYTVVAESEEEAASDRATSSRPPTSAQIEEVRQAIERHGFLKTGQLMERSGIRMRRSTFLACIQVLNPERK